jgi:hypothetical protein
MREDSTNYIGRMLIELFTWYDRVYDNNPVFAKDAWYKVIHNIASTDEIGMDLSHSEFYTVALPRSVQDRTLIPTAFKFSSSHTITHAMDVVATHELIHVLFESLANDFAFSANYEDYIHMEQAGQQCNVEQMDINEKVVLIGASHSRRLCTELASRGLECIDICIPGWTPTPENIELIEKKISEVGIDSGCVAIIDVLSNIVYRYEQYDGTLSLPYKTEGKYHMGGKVSTCTKENIIHTLGTAKGILSHFSGKKIILPPIPRYLFTPCCPAKGHCVGTGTPEHIKGAIESTLGLRKHIQEGLVKAGVTNFTVPDVLQQMLGEKSDFAAMGDKLRTLSDPDGVHLTKEGYAKMADVLVYVIEKSKSAAVNLVTGADAVPKPGYFWRGFKSPVGSMRIRQGAISYKQARMGGGKWKDGAHHWGGPKPGSGRGRGGFRTSFYKR